LKELSELPFASKKINIQVPKISAHIITNFHVLGVQLHLLHLRVVCLCIHKGALDHVWFSDGVDTSLLNQEPTGSTNTHFVCCLAQGPRHKKKIEKERDTWHTQTHLIHVFKPEQHNRANMNAAIAESPATNGHLQYILQHT